ncbi:hypothetical protein ACFPYN_03125 [Paenisporosarcina macmurdoensis]|uniref:Uncharacterized protein n=1 Tax=Paenisporosarcina macmurdoensis TaxID=212659 RepID=A0ABW1L318_9BACL
MGMSWQDSLDTPIENLTEVEAKTLLHEIAVTLAGYNDDKAKHHDKIAEIFSNLANT